MTTPVNTRKPITTFDRTHRVTWAEIDSAVEKYAGLIPKDITLLVGILRAGAPIAAAMSRKTGLPVDYMLCSRFHPQAQFTEGAERAPQGHKILLVDDISGTGWTFRNCIEHCKSLKNEVLTFSMYYCEGPDRFRPDYGDPMDARTYLRWPWEYQQEPEMPKGRT
jgi:adenine/guanine phosphoribosyltransferase-like PRPP-binding protein